MPPQRGEMPPPPVPMDLSSEPTLRQEDFWTDVNSFLNDVGNGKLSISPSLKPCHMGPAR